MSFVLKLLIMKIFFIYREGKIWQGVLTFYCTIQPGVLAAANSVLAPLDEDSRLVKIWKEFKKYLPIANIWYTFKIVRDIADKRKEVSKCDANIENALIPDDRTYWENEKLKALGNTLQFLAYLSKSLTLLVLTDNVRVEESNLMRMKVFTGMGEAAPQFLLQFAMLLHQYGLGRWPELKDGDANLWVNFVLVRKILKVVLSLVQTTNTATKIFSQSKVVTGEGEQSPMRSKSYEIFKIFPCMLFASTPRLVSLSLVFSLVTDHAFTLSDGTTRNSLIFYLPLLFGTLFLYSVCFAGMNYCLKRGDRKGEKHDAPSFILGFFTSIIAPCIIREINSIYYLLSSAMSAVFHSLLLAILLIMSHMGESTQNMMFEVKYNDTLSRETLTVLDQAISVNIACYSLIPSLIVSIFFSWLMFYLFKKENIVLIIRGMIETSDLDGLKKLFAR